jgi:diacylglycerol kinase family enzyme
LPDSLTSRVRSLTVIYNPAAGQRRGAFFTRVLAALEEKGWRAELRTTAGPGDATAMAAAAAREGRQRIAVAGLLGIIPLGTANVLAQEIGLPLRPRAVADCLTGRSQLDVRLGRLGERYFLLMAGAGFDAEVVAAVSPSLKRRFGKGAYVWESLRQGFCYGFPELELELDGEPATARSLIVARARHYGGGFVLSRSAGLETDGLQAFLFGEAGPLSVLRYSLALMLGRLERARGVRCLPVTSLRILGPAGLPLQADGDSVGVTPVEIGLSDRRLRLLVP